MRNENNPFYGKSIYVIGGGNSFDPKLVKRLPKDRVVCLNSTYKYFNNFLALFWMDSGWHRKNASHFEKLSIEKKYYIHINKPVVSSQNFEWLKLASIDHKKYSKYKDTYQIVGNNVGCCVINYLDKMEAKNIYLLGFDCKQVDGKSHCHNEYKFKISDNTYNNIFLPCFNELSKNLINSKVINCSPNSSIKCFSYKNIITILDAEDALKDT